MKQLLLATALIALPVGAFSVFNLYATKPVVASIAPVGLGDLAAFSTIVSDVQTIAATGDLAAAKARIKDFETLWDDQAANLRAVDGNSWGLIDDAADAALKALRASTPDAAKVDATLAALSITLSTPSATASAPVDAVLVAGIAVTDANGRALPCEVMLKSVTDGLAAAKLSDADKAAALDFKTKATERCNADDDARADAFSAQALALVSK